MRKRKMPRVHLTGGNNDNAPSYPRTNDPIFASLIRPGEATATVEYFYVTTDTALLVPDQVTGFQIIGNIGQIGDGPQHIIATATLDTYTDAGSNTNYVSRFQAPVSFRLVPRTMFNNNVSFTIRYLGIGLYASDPTGSGYAYSTPTIAGWALGLNIEYDEEL